VTDGERAGKQSKLPALPLEMGGRRFGIHRPVPRKGQHTREIMTEAGYSEEEINALIEQGAVGAE
jgi:crotonobetainyl-CoA:carnitine CoA-transferase CaiB-like acyl-CoA transferase